MIVLVLVVFVAPVVVILAQSIDNWPWWAMGTTMVVHSLHTFLKSEGTPAGQDREPRPATYLWNPLAMERLYIGLVHGEEHRRRKSAERYVKIHQELISTVDRMGETGGGAGHQGRTLRIEFVWGRRMRAGSR